MIDLNTFKFPYKYMLTYCDTMTASASNAQPDQISDLKSRHDDYEFSCIDKSLKNAISQVYEKLKLKEDANTTHVIQNGMLLIDTFETMMDGIYMQSSEEEIEKFQEGNTEDVYIVTYVFKVSIVIDEMLDDDELNESAEI